VEKRQTIVVNVRIPWIFFIGFVSIWFWILSYLTKSQVFAIRYSKEHAIIGNPLDTLIP